jgi:hypothetical protein
MRTLEVTVNFYGLFARGGALKVSLQGSCVDNYLRQLHFLSALQPLDRRESDDRRVALKTRLYRRVPLGSRISHPTHGGDRGRWRGTDTKGESCATGSIVTPEACSEQ